MHDKFRTVPFVIAQPGEGMREGIDVGRQVACQIGRTAKGCLGAGRERCGHDFVIVGRHDHPRDVARVPTMVNTVSDQGPPGDRQHVLARNALGAAAGRNQRQDFGSRFAHVKVTMLPVSRDSRAASAMRRLCSPSRSETSGVSSPRMQARK